MLDYTTLPNPNMEGGLRRYFENGIEPGSFLSALLMNDLRGAASHADDTNGRLIVEWVRWLYNEAPSPAWGSPQKFAAWMDGRNMPASAGERGPVYAD